jgi:putative PIN family toxin of toxin-antitoxin system
MIITVDTNVIFSALYSSKGASHQILNLIVDEKLILAITNQVYLEYYDVLSRGENLEKLNLSLTEVQDFLDYLLLLAQKYNVYYLLRPNLIDEDDNKIMECAFTSNSEYLVTSNISDFTSGQLSGFNFEILKPGDFYRNWRNYNE